MINFKDIKRQGANAFWDDIPFCDNPYICGNGAKKGFEEEYQAWADGWNEAEREVMGKEEAP